MKTLTLCDGRTLAYTDLGDPQGYPLVFGHGMPGSRLQGHFFHAQAARRGFRILTPDRPGIGGSDYQHGRQLLDYPDDIEQLADALNIERFSHFGWSSGGSRTLACCYKLGERVELGASLSGYTHFAEYNGHHALLEATRWPGPGLARYSSGLVRLVVRLVTRLSRRHPGLYMREAGKLVNHSDRDLLNRLLRGDTFRQDQMICLESGGNAIATDLLTELGNWGFSLRQVKRPVLVFQGEEDAFVPSDYASHLSEHLPEAELTMISGAGHLYPLSEDFQSSFFDRLRQRLLPDTTQKEALPS